MVGGDVVIQEPALCYGRAGSAPPPCRRWREVADAGQHRLRVTEAAAWWQVALDAAIGRGRGCRSHRAIGGRTTGFGQPVAPLRRQSCVLGGTIDVLGRRYAAEYPAVPPGAPQLSTAGAQSDNVIPR